MTALCGGGSSGPQSGVGGVLTLGATAIEVFISSTLGLPELGPVLAPMIAGIVDIDIAGYCGTDPPSDPGLTALDVASALAFPPTASTFAAQAKVLRWFEARYWWQICQCTGTTTPAPITPSNPGPIANNPGLPTQSTPCWSVNLPYTVGARVGTGEEISDLTPAALPAGPITLVTVGTQGSITWQAQSVPMPVGATALAMDATFNEAVVSSTATVAISWNGFVSGGAISGTDRLQVTNTAFGLSSGNIYTAPSLGPSEVTRAVWITNTDTVAHTGTVSISFFCPPGTNVGAACCPPDPILEGELSQILQYVQAIYAGMSTGPSSFAESTVHSGLAGQGSFVLGANTIAVKCVMTSIASWVSSTASMPIRYWQAGHLTFTTSEGPYSAQEVEYAEQVFNVPPLSTSVQYTIGDGYIVTVTELVAGP